MTLPAALRAVIAGALHGVVEWLPVSSSGHVALLIDAADWPEAAEAGRRERRTLEVALHTGSLLPIGARVAADLRAATNPGALIAAGLGATLLTSAVGGTAGPLVERRFAGPRSVAAGLVGGSVALLLAEAQANAWSRVARAADRSVVPAPTAGVTGCCAGSAGEGCCTTCTGPRPLSDLGVGDVVAVGLAQGLAIWPGVSRRAATLSAARARGLDPHAADALSWIVGLPTLLAATLWQFWRSREDLRRAPTAPLAGATTSAAVGLATRALPAATAAWPARRWALWRIALAAATLARR